MRPRRVAVAGLAAGPEQSASLLDALRAFEHGPWWPPLGDLIDAARGFYAGGLTETGLAGTGLAETGLTDTPRLAN